MLTVLTAPAAPTLTPGFLLSAGCHDGLLHSGTRARLPKSPLRRAGEQSPPVADGVRRRIVISVGISGSGSLSLVVRLTFKDDAIRNSAEAETDPKTVTVKMACN